MSRRRRSLTARSSRLRGEPRTGDESGLFSKIELYDPYVEFSVVISILWEHASLTSPWNSLPMRSRVMMLINTYFPPFQILHNFHDEAPVAGLFRALSPWEMSRRWYCTDCARYIWVGDEASLASPFNHYYLTDIDIV